MIEKDLFVRLSKREQENGFFACISFCGFQLRVLSDAASVKLDHLMYGFFS